MSDNQNNCVIDAPGKYHSVIEIVQNVQTKAARIFCDGLKVVTVSCDSLVIHLVGDTEDQDIKSRIEKSPLAVFTAAIDQKKRLSDLESIRMAQRTSNIESIMKMNMERVLDNSLNPHKVLSYSAASKALPDKELPLGFETSAAIQSEVDARLKEARQHAGEYQQVDLYFKDRAQMKEYM